MKTFFTVIIFIMPFIGYSQTVNYSQFQVVQEGNKVVLHWVIEMGSLCNGISILRGTNENETEMIGGIDGVCGSVEVAKSYTFIDPAPVENQTSYYQLLFGTATYSEVQSIYVLKTESGTITISPNPADSDVTFYFENNANLNASIQIISSFGEVMLQSSAVNSDQFKLSAMAFPSGIYFVRITDEKGNVSFGKLLKSSNP